MVKTSKSRYHSLPSVSQHPIRGDHNTIIHGPSCPRRWRMVLAVYSNAVHGLVASLDAIEVDVRVMLVRVFSVLKSDLDGQS